jgi:hypothetical protein
MLWRIAFLTVLTTRAWACSCAGNWPSVKQAWQNTPFVFLGTVESADPDQDPRRAMFHEQTVHIRVDEAFKGVFNGQRLVLHQGASDCDANFRTGQRLVFYLNAGPPGNWRVPSCTRALAEPDGDDLLFLRGLPDSAKSTRLSGQVDLYEDSATQAFRRVGGLPDVKVRITAADFTQEVKTNSAGVYEVFGLRPGRYSVHIDVPKGLKVEFPVAAGSSIVLRDEAAIQLAPDGAASVDFVLRADTRVSGRMLDSTGKPLVDVCIDLEPLEGRGENSAFFFDCSKKGGAFAMEMMPPGKYLLIARDQIKRGALKSESTLYYPGVRDRERATVVEVEAGKYVKNLDIQLPSVEHRYMIQGRFQYSDGAPVRDVSVRFTSPAHGYSESTTTSSDGSFSLPVVAGFEGELSGTLTVSVFQDIQNKCPDFHLEPREQGLMRSMDAAPIALKADSDHAGVQLKLSSPSCKFWPPPKK